MSHRVRVSHLAQQHRGRRRTHRTHRGLGLRDGSDLTRQPTRVPATRCAIGKRRFMTRSDAEIVLACLDRTDSARREKRVYCCPACDGWHLTSWSLEEYHLGSNTGGHDSTTGGQATRRPTPLQPAHINGRPVPTPLEVAARTVPITRSEAPSQNPAPATSPARAQPGAAIHRGSILRARLLTATRWVIGRVRHDRRSTR